MNISDDIVISILREEVAFRRSKDLYDLYRETHYDNDGDPISTPDLMEIYAQMSLLKKYGIEMNEENRNYYLNRCHELKDDPRVKEINPPHIYSNPYFPKRKYGKFDMDILLARANGERILTRELFQGKNVCFVIASAS